MSPHPSSSPLERPDELADLLREQGVAPADVARLLATAQRLADWPSPQPSPAGAQRLLARLTAALPAPSPVRQAIQEHQRETTHLRWLLALARTQVSLFGLAFWLVSALVTLVGAAAVLGQAPTHLDVLLGATGPLLAYVGTSIAFRGTHRHALELELVCPPSPVQLAIARLVIVLGYDVGLGLALSLVVWAGGAPSVLSLTLSWFMPLLLVAGAALLLSLRLATQEAAALAYGGWLAVLAISVLSQKQAVLLAPRTEALMGCLGLALLALALVRLHAELYHVLPRA